MKEEVKNLSKYSANKIKYGNTVTQRRNVSWSESSKCWQDKSCECRLYRWPQCTRARSTPPWRLLTEEVLEDEEEGCAVQSYKGLQDMYVFCRGGELQISFGTATCDTSFKIQRCDIYMYIYLITLNQKWVKKGASEGHSVSIKWILLHHQSNNSEFSNLKPGALSFKTHLNHINSTKWVKHVKNWNL